MPHLKDLKSEIDAGRTAKLFIPPIREGGVSITIRVKKYGQYFWQRASLNHALPLALSPRPNTAGFPTWDDLINEIDTQADQWQLCDEPLEMTPSILEFLYPPEGKAKQEA